MLRLKQLPAAKRKWITSPSIPAELIIAACFCALWAIGLLAGLPINLPTSDHATLLQVHFFAPMVLAASVQMALAFLVACVRSQRAARELDPFLMLRCLPLVAICCISTSKRGRRL